MKIFRKFRIQFLSKNRFTKYLVYAIGEIFLVVIGILIAVQVNNWNNQRLDQQKEKILLKNLNEEFVKNREVLNRILPISKSALNANLNLLQLCEFPNANIPLPQIDSLFDESFNHPPFDAPHPVFQEIMNFGKLDRLSDPILKEKLYEWQDNLNRLQMDHNKLESWTDNQLHPFLIKHVSYKNWGVVSGSTDRKKRSRLTNDYNAIFESLEFENLIENKIFWINKICDRQQEFIEVSEEIIEASSSGS